VAFEERAHVSSESFEAQPTLWQPEITIASDQGEQSQLLDLSPGDRYVAVDDLAEGLAVLQASLWPHLDADGRLTFEGDPLGLVTPLERLQRLVDEARAAARQLGADRPIRVGDAFAMRGLSGEEPSIETATRIIDVSAAARDAAKAALYGAAASTVDEEYSEKMALEGEAPAAAHVEGDFDVRQDATVREELGGDTNI
jgi:hypothetical protein